MQGPCFVSLSAPLLRLFFAARLEKEHEPTEPMHSRTLSYVRDLRTVRRPSTVVQHYLMTRAIKAGKRLCYIKTESELVVVVVFFRCPLGKRKEKIMKSFLHDSDGGGGGPRSLIWTLTEFQLQIT